MAKKDRVVVRLPNEEIIIERWVRGLEEEEIYRKEQQMIEKYDKEQQQIKNSDVPSYLLTINC